MIVRAALIASLAMAAVAQAGTPRTALSLVTQTDLASRDNRSREPFYLQVAQALVADGQVIVPAGSIAVGEIVSKNGEMAVRLLYVSAPAGRMKLAPTSGAAVSVDKRDGLMSATRGRIRPGTPVMAYLAEKPQFGQDPVAVAAR
jgi:hypothetical protein